MSMPRFNPRACSSGSQRLAECESSTIPGTIAMPLTSPRRRLPSSATANQAKRARCSTAMRLDSLSFRRLIRCTAPSRVTLGGRSGEAPENGSDSSERGRGEAIARRGRGIRRNDARSLLSPFLMSARENDPSGKDRQRMKIEGSVAVVTGGASGLGEATAQRLAEGGGRVAILDRPQSEGERVAEAIGGLFCAADVTSGEQIADAIAKTVDTFGGLQIVVNC